MVAVLSTVNEELAVRSQAGGVSKEEEAEGCRTQFSDARPGWHGSFQEQEALAKELSSGVVSLKESVYSRKVVE